MVTLVPSWHKLPVLHAERANPLHLKLLQILKLFTSSARGRIILLVLIINIHWSRARGFSPGNT